MAEEKKIATGYIGNALRSAAYNHTTTFADEVFDTERQQYQNEVNGIVGTYIENPEFLFVKTDAEGRLLWWIEKDGTVNWSKGVPQPIQVKLQELEQKIKGNEDDDKTLGERVTANEAAIVAINDTLDNYKIEVAEALSKKMDGEYVEDTEYVYVKTDSEGHILYAIKSDGKIYYGGAIPPQVQDAINKAVEDLQVDITSQIEDLVRIINEHLDDIETRIPQDTPSNQEFIQATIDSEGTLIEGIRADGTRFIAKLESPTTKDAIKESSENLSTLLLQEKQRAEGAEAEIVDNQPSHYDDTEEFVKVEVDAEGRILSEIRTNEDIEIHHTPHKFEKLILGDNTHIESLSDLEQALKDSGFSSGTGVWSDYYSADGDKPLHLAIPRCAMINILNSFDLTKLSKAGLSGAIEGVNYNILTEVEFWDMQGNYFKKWALMSGQGASSMSLPKKSIALNFYESKEDALADNEGFSIRFGDWIAQSSFHLKAFYTDFFKGVAIVGYQLANQILRSRLPFEDRPWKKALLASYNYQDGVYNADEYSNLELQLDTGARCVPDAFPCIVHQNGEFYGIFSFALKKHRDNYHQKKDNPKHVHIDGAFYDRKDEEGNPTHHSIWMGILDWSVFEIRNPKYLVYKEPINGSYEYNADVKQAEIAGLNDGESAQAYDPLENYSTGKIVTYKDRLYMSKTDVNVGNDPSVVSYKAKPKDVYKKSNDFWIEITFTNEVKQYIIRISKQIPACKSAATLEEKREIFDASFDKDNIIDWCNHTNFIYNADSTQNNTQWVTYDGIKWWACIYDLDIAFGINSSIGTTVGAPNKVNIVSGDGFFPGAQCWTCYADDVKARYKECRDKGIFTYENIEKMMLEWFERIGYKNYSLEYSKWTESPCNRDPNGTYTRYPTTGGHYDNLYRLMTWLRVRSKYVDEFMGITE